MKTKLMLIAAAMLVSSATIASAQGIIPGADEGIRKGTDAAGPVGGVIGGVTGAVTGGINGLLGIDQRPRFREYVVREHRHSYHYAHPVEVGVVLPNEGVEYYDVPDEYGVHSYKYTIVDDRVVLVEPTSHKIVQIVE